MSFQKKLQETQHTLTDLEEKHRQAISTIKEKEFLISNLLKSGKLHPLCWAKGELFWLVISLWGSNVFVSNTYFIKVKLGYGCITFFINISKFGCSHNHLAVNVGIYVK